MKIDDLVSVFNTTYFMRDFPENYEGVSKELTLKPSYGNEQGKGMEWLKNP